MSALGHKRTSAAPTRSTSSAIASTSGGIVRPSVFAVLKIVRKLELGRLFDLDVGCERVLFPEVLFAHKGGERMTPIKASTIAIPRRMRSWGG
jgi:hypothetical protein